MKMKIPFVTAAVILLVAWGSASAEPGQKAVDEIKRMESQMERRGFERDSRGLDREQMPSVSGMPGGSGWKW